MEGVGGVHNASGEQFPHPAVWVRGAGCGQGGELLDVIGPRRAQCQDRPALWAYQQMVHSRSDLFTGRRVTKVVVRVVQPYDCVRTDTVKIRQSSICPGGIEWMPQPPPVLRQRLHSLPARARLAC